MYFVLFAYLLKSLFKCPGYSAPNWRMTVDGKLRQDKEGGNRD